MVKEVKMTNDSESSQVIKLSDNNGVEQVSGALGMSVRQFAAIQLKVPMSWDPELDAMIRESRRLDFSGQAITGALHESQFPMRTAEDAARLANGVIVEWLDHYREGKKEAEYGHSE
jgi:hypothetical protein